MKQIEIPQGEEERKKKGAAVARTRKVCGVFVFVIAISSVLLLMGTIAAVLVLELGTSEPSRDWLLYILIGSFAGGAILFAVVGFLLGRLLQFYLLRELDYRERCDSEYSFFVGEGTLAKFETDGIFIRSEDGRGETIRVPYTQLRAFSVCSRHAPREKGEWSVVLEIPASYLAKPGKAKRDDPPALVQTDAKERLYRCLEERGVPLLGEPPEQKKRAEKFKPRCKYLLPNRKKRKRALLMLALGVVLIGVAVPVGLYEVSIGSILGVFGAFIIGRAVNDFVRAKGIFAVYEEGIYWRDTTPEDSVFLKWEEIGAISPEEREGIALLNVQCAYGAYHLPNIGGAYDYLREFRPEKCRGAQ